MGGGSPSCLKSSLPPEELREVGAPHLHFFVCRDEATNNEKKPKSQELVRIRSSSENSPW